MRTDTSKNMTRPDLPGPRAGVLPEVTPRERDFWRRAVAAERERLALGCEEAAVACPAGTH